MRWDKWATYLLGLVFVCLGGCDNGSTSQHDSVQDTIETASITDSMPVSSNKIELPPEATPSFLLGKFNPADDSLFTRMHKQHTGGSARNQYIQKRTYKAFVDMYEAAQKEGIQLVILSAARNFTYQKSIWERKWKGERLVEGENLATSTPNKAERARKILRYSSMPGSSRHHWGTDIDLNKFNNEWFNTAEGKKVYDWLTTHASTYGFCQPYTAKGEQRPQGYEEEKWHWSYMPLAIPYLNAYEEKIKVADINGFLGSETVDKVNIIDHYVMGIHRDCK